MTQELRAITVRMKPEIYAYFYQIAKKTDRSFNWTFNNELTKLLFGDNRDTVTKSQEG